RAEQSRQSPFGDAVHSDLAANLRPPNSPGSRSAHFIQNETPVQNNDVIESHGVQRLVPTQSTLTGPPSQPGQILGDIHTPASQLPCDSTTIGFSGEQPIDDDWMQDFLGNTS